MQFSGSLSEKFYLLYLNLFFSSTNLTTISLNDENFCSARTGLNLFCKSRPMIIFRLDLIKFLQGSAKWKYRAMPLPQLSCWSLINASKKSQNACQPHGRILLLIWMLFFFLVFGAEFCLLIHLISTTDLFNISRITPNTLPFLLLRNPFIKLSFSSFFSRN